MNFRVIRLAAYLVYFFTSTIPLRKKLNKLQETDPKEAFKLSHEHAKKAVLNIAKIAKVDLEVSGLDQLPEEACLFIGNHRGYFDVVLAEFLIPGGAGFVAKDSLQKIPGLSGWMELMRCLFLDRSDLKAGVRMIQTGAEYIKEGYPMVIFPEGTRAKTEELLEFKGGSFKMAQKSKCPIVPMAISGTNNVFENNQGFRITPATVKITFGKPFYMNDLPKEEKKHIGEYTRDQIISLLEEQKKADWNGTEIHF